VKLIIFVLAIFAMPVFAAALVPRQTYQKLIFKKRATRTLRYGNSDLRGPNFYKETTQ
jgi:hypothetical protein